MWQDAALAAEAAAEAARRIGARQEAAGFERKVLNFLEELEPDATRRINCLLNLEDDLHTLGQRKAQSDTLARIETLIDHLQQASTLLYRRGRYLRSLGQLNEAKKTLALAAKHAKGPGLYDSQLELAYTLIEDTDFAAARTLAEKTREAAATGQNLYYELEAAFCLAEAAIKQDNYDRALSLLEPFTPLARLNKMQEAKLWRTLAEASVRRNKRDLMRYATRALSAYTSLNDLRGQADALRLQFYVASTTYQFTRAESLLTQAIDYYKVVADTRQVAGMQGNLAVLHALRCRFTQSAEVAEKAYGAFTRLADKRGQLISAINLADALNKTDDFSGAEHWAKLALNGAKELDMQSSQALALVNIGNAQRGQEQFALSLKSYTRALTVHDSQDAGYAVLLAHLALASFACKELETARSYLTKAENWLEQHGRDSQLVPASKAYILHAVGQTSAAASALETARNSLSDSLKPFSASERSYALKHHPTYRFIVEAEKGNWLNGRVVLR